ncbi:N-6 DNA methylase [Paenibacillus sp. HJGM_3]|uniref:N-6 DNA methylase n=1 Tax=Paenibacillus sp. HJGM_3 TaxID=3379816 RepID=UPI00385C6404
MKRKINTLRDILVGKIPDPKSQVEQITIAMVFKFMDDMDKEFLEDAFFGGERKFFVKIEKDDYSKYAWTNLMSPQVGGQERSDLYREGIEKMYMNPNLPDFFREVFRNAYMPFRDSETINLFLKEIDDFTYDNSEDLGEAFEMMLSIMSSQGDAGQFRTPRHIIDMIVDIVQPEKRDRILDPACGTAGFLISAYKYILEHNKDERGNITLTPDEKIKLTNNIEGYDISQDMVRFSRVNMYLHHFQNPKVYEYDTLTSLDRWDDQFDVILANPPFMTPKGGINPHNKFRVQAKRSEVLFVDYIAEHLAPNGRAGIIVPEGIVFQTQSAYKELRKFLIDDQYLYAVISLPAGVFNPYSGVKTSILLFDKALSKMTDEVFFVKIENDGYDLGAQRREIAGSQVQRTVEYINSYKEAIIQNEVFVLTEEQKEFAVIAKKIKVAEESYVLVGERYKGSPLTTEAAYPVVKLGEVCSFMTGGTPKSEVKEYYEDGSIPWLVSGDIHKGFISDCEGRITEMGLENSNAKILPYNSVLIALNGQGKTRGTVAILKMEGATCNQSIVAITPNDIAELQPEFLYYQLKARYQEIRGLTGDNQRSGLNIPILKSLNFVLPPITVQQQIITEISRYEKIISGANLIIENYKPFVKIDSSWDLKRVEEVVEFISGVTLSIGECEAEDGIPIITIADVTEDGYIRYENVRRVATSKAANFLQKDDLLFNWRNGSKNLVGKTARFESCEPHIFASFLLGLRPKPIILSEFLWAILNQYRVEGKYMKFMRQNINGLFNREELKDVLVPVPPISVQHQIVNQISEELSIIDKNKRLIDMNEQKISDSLNEIWCGSPENDTKQELAKGIDEFKFAARNASKQFIDVVQARQKTDLNG